MSQIEEREKEDDDRNRYKIRRNVAHISAQERTQFRDAILKLNETYYPDGVSHWFKQDQIHQVSDVHGGPAFLTWHRELLNRYEALLQQIDPRVALHYWDWTTDPRNSPDGRGGFVNLFTSDFMGNSQGSIGEPYTSRKFDNGGVEEGSRQMGGVYNPAAPPQSLTRDMMPGAASPISDLDIINTANNLPRDQQWNAFRIRIETGILHNRIHGWIGGNNAAAATAFEDPFVYIFHANIDRLWAMWQTATGYDWRLNADQTYGIESNHPDIVEDLEPWAGKKPTQRMRPWASPDNQQFSKNSKHPSIILPPRYDTIHSHQTEKNEDEREKEDERG